jgi:hypothetical protein
MQFVPIVPIRKPGCVMEVNNLYTGFFFEEKGDLPQLLFIPFQRRMNWRDYNENM